MVTIAIIGNGFIGKHLKCSIEAPYDCYSKKNINMIKNKNYDLVYCAGLSGNKNYVNNNGDEDLMNIFSLQENLSKAYISRFILISSIDIYDNNFKNQDENSFKISQESYGKNRYFMEKWALEKYKNCHIIRLPELFGHGLSNNIIFDILNNNCLECINFNTSYQWYCISNLMDDIQKIIDKNIRIINLLSEPVETIWLISKCFPNFIIPMLDNKKRIEYNYKSVWFNSGYTIDKKNIISDLLKYIHLFSIIETINTEKLVISNQSFNTKNDISCIEYLKLLSIKSINLTISKYIDFYNAEKSSINKLYKKFVENSIDIYSINNLFYNTNLNLFVDKHEFSDHFKKIIDYGIIMNASILIYNCPHSRLLPPNINKPTANFIFIDLFKHLCEYIEFLNSNIIIALTPCHKCNYINTITDAISIIDKINNKHFRLNYDTGEAIANNEKYSINDLQDYIVNTSLSLPNYKELISIDSYDDILYKSFHNPGKICLEIDNCTDFKNNIIKFASLYCESQ